MNLWLYVLVIAPLVRYIIGDSFSNQKQIRLGRKFKKLLLCTLIIVGVESYRIYRAHIFGRPPTPYRTLGISRNANRREISTAVRQKLRLYHPDLRRDVNTVEQFKQIRNDADLLLNGQRRNLYDQLGDFIERKSVDRYENEDTTTIFILFICASIERAGWEFLMAIVVSLSIHNLNQRQIQNYLGMLLAIYSAELLVRFSPIVRFDTDLEHLLRPPVIIEPMASTISTSQTLFQTWNKFSQFSLVGSTPVLRNFAPFELAHLLSACVPMFVTLQNFLGSYWTEVLSDYEFKRYKERSVLEANKFDEDVIDATGAAEAVTQKKWPSFKDASPKELTEAMMIIAAVNLRLFKTFKELKVECGVDSDESEEVEGFLRNVMDGTLDVEFGISVGESGWLENVRRRVLMLWRGDSDRTLVQLWTERFVEENKKIDLDECIEKFAEQCENLRKKWAERRRKDQKRQMMGPILLLAHVAFSKISSR